MEKRYAKPPQDPPLTKSLREGAMDSVDVRRPPERPTPKPPTQQPPANTPKK